MHPVCLHDPQEIEAYLRRDVELHLYEIGDLDPFFWPYTTWYAQRAARGVEQLFLVYTGTDLPVLLATARPQGIDKLCSLLQASLPFLPRRFYSHLSPGAQAAFEEDYRLESHGLHYKMALRDPRALDAVDTSQVEQLSSADLDDLLALYEAAYPGNWFDARMLETGMYFGIRLAGSLVAVAGIHVYSPHFRVATIGNVTTHPDYRCRGLGQQVCARLSLELLKNVDHVGLNVKADNAPAIHSYRKLGFVKIAEYEEFMAELK